MTSIRLDRGDMQSIRFALRRTARSMTECDDLIPLADQLAAIDVGTLDDDRVPTVTVPEGAWETLIDLRNAVGDVVRVESQRRRARTLGLDFHAGDAEGRLYDSLSRLQGEYDTACHATAALAADRVVDAEVADA
jgi:hypothetical protein